MKPVIFALIVSALPATIANAQEKSAEEVVKMLTEAKPLYGGTATVCAGQTAPGWAVINVGTNFTTCGGNWDNIWTL